MPVTGPFVNCLKKNFSIKVDEGLADVDAGKYMISESAESELAVKFGLANK